MQAYASLPALLRASVTCPDRDELRGKTNILYIVGIVQPERLLSAIRWQRVEIGEENVSGVSRSLVQLLALIWIVAMLFQHPGVALMARSNTANGPVHFIMLLNPGDRNQLRV